LSDNLKILLHHDIYYHLRYKKCRIFHAEFVGIYMTCKQWQLKKRQRHEPDEAGNEKFHVIFPHGH
jgi:hypothetical protein